MSSNTYVSGGHAMHRPRNTVKSRQTRAEKKIGARERAVRRRHQEYRERKRGDVQKMKSHKIRLSVAL